MGEHGGCRPSAAYLDVLAGVKSAYLLPDSVKTAAAMQLRGIQTFPFYHLTEEQRTKTETVIKECKDNLGPCMCVARTWCCSKHKVVARLIVVDAC